jgi:dynein heavy chain
LAWGFAGLFETDDR